MGFTSWQWRAAAQQPEVQVVCAKALTPEVLQQLSQIGPEGLRAVEAEPVGAFLDLEVLVVAHGTRILLVDLEAKTERFEMDKTSAECESKVKNASLILERK